MEEEWLRNLRAEDDAVPEDDLLEEIGEILASMSKGKEKAHKRTISEVILGRRGRGRGRRLPRSMRRSMATARSMR
jgi:hypothetical protein